MSALENSGPSIDQDQMDPAVPPFELAVGFRPWSPCDGDRQRPELGGEARHGLVGEVAELFEAGSEIDGAAVIFQLLAVVGAMVGRTNWFPVGVDRHYPNLFVAVVGPPGTGTKGMGLRAALDVARRADPGFVAERVTGGIRSREALIDFVRDEEMVDKAVVARSADDQRAVVTTELADLFATARRGATNVSEALCGAWDGTTLHSTARTPPVRSGEACVSVIAHATPGEARDHVSGDGARLGGRFLFAWSQRQRAVPLPREVPHQQLESAAAAVAAAVGRARDEGGPWALSPSAAKLWGDVYGELSGPTGGLRHVLAAHTSAIALRAAVLYAIVDPYADQLGVVQVAHLRAALALCRYSAATIEYVFGDAQGDLLTDRLLEAVRTAGPSGLSVTDQFAKVGGHFTKDRLDRARDLLEARHLIATGHRGTGSTRTRVSVAISPAP